MNQRETLTRYDDEIQCQRAPHFPHGQRRETEAFIRKFERRGHHLFWWVNWMAEQKFPSIIIHTLKKLNSQVKSGRRNTVYLIIL